MDIVSNSKQWCVVKMAIHYTAKYDTFLSFYVPYDIIHRMVSKEGVMIMLNSNYVTLDDSLLLSNEWTKNIRYHSLESGECTFQEICELVAGWVFDIICAEEDMIFYEDIFLIGGIRVFYLPVTKTLFFQSGDNSIKHYENIKQWLV